ncbi:MAG TPA: hypothetical protein ENG66_09480 [Thermococcus sp.]|nr:hypothetical protein [Thermococcus sp.]
MKSLVRKKFNAGITSAGAIIIVLIFLLVVVAISIATYYYVQASNSFHKVAELVAEKNKEALAVYLLPDNHSLLVRNIGCSQKASKIVSIIVVEYLDRDNLTRRGPVIYTESKDVDLPTLGMTTILFNFTVSDENVVGVVTSLGNLFYATPSDLLVFDVEGLPLSGVKVLTVTFNNSSENTKSYSAKNFPVLLNPYESQSYTFTWKKKVTIGSVDYEYRGTVGIVTLDENSTTGQLTVDKAHGVIKAIYVPKSQEVKTLVNILELPALVYYPAFGVILFCKRSLKKIPLFRDKSSLRGEKSEVPKVNY